MPEDTRERGVRGEWFSKAVVITVEAHDASPALSRSRSLLAPDESKMMGPDRIGPTSYRQRIV